MAQFKAAKIVGTLPTGTDIDPDCLYVYRVGDGFDLYCSNNTGVVLHKLNDTDTSIKQLPVNDWFDNDGIAPGTYFFDNGLKNSYDSRASMGVVDIVNYGGMALALVEDHYNNATWVGQGSINTTTGNAVLTTWMTTANDVGDIADLTTDDPSSIVNAVNEINHKRPILGNGRPDVLSSLTPVIKTKVENALVGTIFTSMDGAGVGAWQWQMTPDGWRLNDGDTGWIDLSQTVGTNKSPYYQIKRAGSTVHLVLDKWTGNRIQLPMGFTAGDSFFQFVVPLLDGTAANIELSSTGDVYLLGSNQGKPWNKPATADDFKTKSTFNNTWKIIKMHNLGMKVYITFSTPDPYPTELPTALTASEYKRGNTYVDVNGMTCTGTGFNKWANITNYVSVESTGDIISGDDVTCNVPFPRATLGTTIEIRAGADGSATNGATIWYSTDSGATWVDSGIVTAGHTDNEAMRDVKYYDIPVADVTNVSIRKTGFKMNSFLLSCKEYETP